MIARAPAKLNLCLYVGGRREDGLHELRSLFCPLELSDRLVIGSAEGDADEVVCDGVEGPNLAMDALEALRELGWKSPPLRIEIAKRIPVAAGLGGGSADAAAVLRMADGEVGPLEEVAARLGADVPSQLKPAFTLVSGAGERSEALPAPHPFGVVLVPFDQGLGAGEVYAEFDRLGLGRADDELRDFEMQLLDAATTHRSPLDYAGLLHNDLEDAALSLRPEIGDALAALREQDAQAVFVTGSGPTAVGLFTDIVAADRAAGALPPRFADAIVTSSTSRVTGF